MSLVRDRAASGRRVLLPALRRGGLPPRPARLGNDLLLRLQPALRLLPEPRHFMAGTGRARHGRTAGGDDARATGDRLPQRQLGHARACRPADPRSAAARLRGRPRAANRLHTSAYDSPDSLRLMEGIVDVYMPDFKLWTNEAARRYLKRADYPDVARETIVEMNRQVGDLVLDEHGMARRGLILRHLIMPGLLEETESILRFVAEELGRGTYVNLMAQYYVSGKVGENGQYEEIARGIHREEYERALVLARELGLRLDPRSVEDRQRLARAV